MTGRLALLVAAGVTLGATVAIGTPSTAVAQLPAGAPLTVEDVARLLGPGGNPAVATMTLQSWTESAPPTEATHWIQLLAVVERVEPGSAPVAVRAVGAAVEGRGAVGAEAIVAALPAAAETDHAVLLALAAILAEPTEPLRAAELRERFLAEHGDAPEMPEIAFRHGRWLVSIEARRAEGVRMLEDLIVAVPNHPIVPEARRIWQMHRAGAE